MSLNNILMLRAFEISELVTPKRDFAYFKAQNGASLVQKMTTQLLKSFPGFKIDNKQSFRYQSLVIPDKPFDINDYYNFANILQQTNFLRTNRVFVKDSSMMTNESSRTLRNKTFDSEQIFNEEKLYLCSNLEFDFEMKKWTDNKQGLNNTEWCLLSREKAVKDVNSRVEFCFLVGVQFNFDWSIFSRPIQIVINPD